MSKICVETPERDELGYWYHSALKKFRREHPHDAELVDVYTEWQHSVGIKHVEYTYMLCDETAPVSLQEDYANGVTGGCAGWEPKQPLPGINGVLYAIFDTEDGPVACFGYYLPTEEVMGAFL